MPKVEVEKLRIKGIEAIKNGNTLSALILFEKVIQMENSPINRSYLAFCLAKERGQFKKAVSMCEEAIKEEPNNSIHYLNLGRIYLISDHKTDAIRSFREGLGREGNKEIINELILLGLRRPLLIPFLKRGSFINKYFGIIFSRLGLR